MQSNIVHLHSKTKDKITNEDSNTLLNGELINESELPQFSSKSIRKNIQTVGEKRKRKVSRK